MAWRLIPILCAFLHALPARAADGDDPPELSHFAKGSWTFQTYAGYLNDLGAEDTEGGFATAGVSYYFVDDVSLGVEFSGYGLTQPGEDAVAGAAGVVLRHHLLHADRTGLFVDVAFAPAEASARVPQGGTRFNFFTQVGVGVTHALPGGPHLLLGARFAHVSNANIEGDDRNPSVNGVSAYAGLLFRL
jgi:hypothetical protein